jgi:hypothetical protein
MRTAIEHFGAISRADPDRECGGLPPLAPKRKVRQEAFQARLAWPAAIIKPRQRAVQKLLTELRKEPQTLFTASKGKTRPHRPKVNE